MTDPTGTLSFVFPRPSTFSLALPRGTLRNERRQNWQFPLRLVLSAYSSVTSQDEPKPALWLATREGDKSFPESRIVNYLFITLVHQLSWLRTFALLIFCELMDLIHKHSIKNLANIQPYWPHAWLITHILPTILPPLFLEEKWVTAFWRRVLFDS